MEIIKREHEILGKILNDIESFLDKENIDASVVTGLLHDFGKMWNSHELREERIFAEKTKREGSFPEETMLIEQHRELKGHWLVLQNAISSENNEKIRVALDIDGRMLIDKFRNHISFEEEFFDSYKNN